MKNSKVKESAVEEEKKSGTNPEDLSAEQEAESSTETSAESEESEETEAAEEETDEEETDGANDKVKARIAELEDRYARLQAEYANYMKRTDKEKTQMFDMGAKSIVEKILPTIDNFERGLATLSEEQKKEPFAEGMDKVYQQMMTELEKAGVTAIEALGKEMDPNLFNAVMQVESDEYESGVVAQELQKGYMYHDTVVRHSMVAVVQ